MTDKDLEHKTRLRYHERNISPPRRNTDLGLPRSEESPFGTVSDPNVPEKTQSCEFEIAALAIQDIGVHGGEVGTVAESCEFYSKTIYCYTKKATYRELNLCSCTKREG